MRFWEHGLPRPGGVAQSEPLWACACGFEALVRRTPSRASRVDLSELHRTIAKLRDRARTVSSLAGDPREQARRLLDPFDDSLVSVLAADDDARYIAANAAACVLTGYTRDDLMTMTIWDLSADSEAVRGPRIWQRFLADGSFQGQYHLRRKTCDAILVSCVAAARVLPHVHVSAMAPPRLIPHLGPA